jgi:hypothetical protein
MGGIGLLLVAAVAVVVFLIVRATRGGGAFRAFAARRPRKRRLVTRIVCGSLGGLILLAVTIGTFREVGSVYATDEQAAGLMLHVPTKEVELPAIPRRQHPVELERARLLYAIVIAERRGEEWIPVRVAEHELRLPSDNRRRFGKMSIYGIRIEHEFVVDRIVAVRERIAFRLHGREDFNATRSMRGYRGRGGSMDSEPVAHIYDASGGWPRTKSPLSIARGPSPELHAFHVATLVAADDPLKKVPAAELLNSRRKEFKRATRQLDTGYSRWVPSDEDIPLRGLGAAVHFGVASLLLLVAAILFSQLFARKGLAFAETLSGVVLFTAVLDRAALGSHLSRVEDKEAPIAVRMTGCVHAADTFFYRGTAASRLRSVMEDDATPETLRDLAGEVEIELDSSAIGRSVGYFVGYPARQYRDVPNLTEFELDGLAPELERRFPVLLSSKALGEGDSGLWIAYDNRRSVATLGGIVRLTLKIRRCANPSCERFHVPYRPEAEGAFALPEHEFGLDVIALVGSLRHAGHRSVPEIHKELVRRGLDICERTVTNLLDRYDELAALSLASDERLQRITAEQGRVVLAIDGLQPDVGHEVLYESQLGSSQVSVMCCAHRIKEWAARNICQALSCPA